MIPDVSKSACKLSGVSVDIADIHPINLLELVIT